MVAFIYLMELDAVIRDLERVRRECSTLNWDGYNAAPVTEESYSLALQFVRLLPREVPSPKVCGDPNGKMLFEWHKESDYVFDVSVGNGKLIYAGLFGAQKFHGNADFGEEIPNEILTSLKRFYT